MGADETGPQIAAIIRAAPCRPEFNVSGSTAEYRFRDAGFTLYFTNRVLETVYLFTQHFQDHLAILWPPNLGTHFGDHPLCRDA